MNLQPRFFKDVQPDENETGGVREDMWEGPHGSFPPAPFPQQGPCSMGDTSALGKPLEIQHLRLYWVMAVHRVPLNARLPAGKLVLVLNHLACTGEPLTVLISWRRVAMLTLAHWPR